MFGKIQKVLSLQTVKKRIGNIRAPGKVVIFGVEAYLDTTKAEHKICGKYSANEVYFQNSDSPEVPDELTLDVDESYGATEIHVPAEWYVDWRVDNKFGAVEIRPNPEVYVKKLIITGTNRYGAIEVD